MEELEASLNEATPELLASPDAGHGFWADALRARLILHGDDPTGATQLVRSAHDAFHTTTKGPERANGIAFLSELYAQAGHFELATDLTIIAGDIIEHPKSAISPCAELVEACAWLSRSLATIGLFEPAAHFADRGRELNAGLGKRAWPGLRRYGAFMHLLRAEELHRAGRSGAAVVHIVAAEHGLGPIRVRTSWENPVMHETLTMLLAGWVALARGQTDKADQIFADATLPQLTPEGRWLTGAAKYLRGRTALEGGNLDRASELLAEASASLVRWSWHRMYEWCLLDLIKVETDLGHTREALGWVEVFLNRRTKTNRRRQELATELFKRRVAVLNENRQRSTFVRQAVEDPLTHLGNRRRAEERLADLLGEESQAPVCLAVVDVDGFKRVNDEASHTMGDAVLIRVAELISENSRAKDLVARWAGDEFVVVMPTTTEEQAFTAMERLRRTIAGYDWTQTGLRRPITVSIGMAAATATSTARGLFAAADAPLFAAKRAGRNRVMNAGQALVESGGTVIRRSR